jgi:hypothetical protein
VSDRPRSRNLCLLVVYNAPLVVAWMNTLNNDALAASLKGNLIRQADYHDEVCWKENKGFTVWDATRKDPPVIDARGLCNVDVVCITAATLQTNPNDCWVTKLKWHTVVGEEGHEYLRGQHNKKNAVSLTLQNWKRLQYQTKSTFVVTGTPFITNIPHDFVAMSKAVAREEIRQTWGPEFTDAGLEELVDGWVSNIDAKDEARKEKQAQLEKRIKEALSKYMLRRDHLSKIRGKPVMIDYFKQCTNFETPVKITPAEIERREGLYREHFVNSNRMTRERNDNMRCLQYSYRFVKWKQAKSNAERRRCWDTYTLAEAEEQCLTKELIRILRQGKETKNGVIVFVQRTFQAECVLKVCVLG